jgi:hypothetical protein
MVTASGFNAGEGKRQTKASWAFNSDKSTSLGSIRKWQSTTLRFQARIMMDMIDG